MSNFLDSAKKSTNNAYLDALVLALVWPAFALFRAIRKYKESWAKNILWLFVAFYGYTFIISGNMDSVRYTERLVQMSQQRVLDFSEFLSLIYAPEIGYPDVIEPLITFILSRFTSDGHILMAAFGIVFGFFYSRNLWYLLNKIDQGGLKKNAVPFLLLSTMLVTIWAINGFRFWTACHVFIYGFLNYVDGKRMPGILFAIGSVLVHFSFLVPVTLLLVWIVLGNFLVPYYLIFFASFFVSETNPQALNVFSLSVPEIFQERTEKYINKEYVKNRVKSEENRNWYIRYRLQAIRYATNVLLIYVFFFLRNYVRSNRMALDLLSYGLLLASLGNILSTVPSMVRFQVVSLIILSSFLFIITQENYTKRAVFPVLLRVPFIFVTALYIVVEVRIGFDTIGPMAVFGNPLVALFVSSETPLIDFIK